MSVPTIGRLTVALTFFTLLPDALTSQPIGTDAAPVVSERLEVAGHIAIHGPMMARDPDPTNPPCAAERDQGPTERRIPKFLGWLYRWARGYDLEGSSTPAPNLYPRSPLLSGFDDRGGCPVPDPTPMVTCVTVTASDGHEHQATYLMSLPQMGARTPDQLKSRLQELLAKGKPVALRLLGGGQTDLDPALAVTLKVKVCESEIGD